MKQQYKPGRHRDFTPPEEEYTLEEVATMLGKSAVYLRKLCNAKRGVPGSKRKPWGNRHVWMLSPASIDYLRKELLIPTYDDLLKEWFEGLSTGKITRTRNPATPDTIHNYMHTGMYYFWKYSEAPEAVESLTYANLEKALLAVPFDRDKESCGYAVKSSIYGAMRSIYKLLVIKRLRTKEEREALTELRPRRAFKAKINLIRENQFHQILAAIESMDTGRKVDEFYRECTKTIVYLMALGGLRRHEVAGLKLSDLDFPHSEISVLGKGNKRESVGACPELMAQLQKWIEVYRAPIMKDFEYDQHNYVLIQPDGHELSINAVIHKIKRLSKRSGIKCSCHTFRHFCATFFADRGVPQHKIQAQLRHADATTTHRYIHIHREEAIAEFKKPVF